MQSNPRYFFKKDDRLKGRKSVDELFREGKSFTQTPFRVVWKPSNEKAALQVGVTVSSRHFKKAVDRNRIKRLMREAWRLQKHALQQELQSAGKSMSVFILYTARELPLYELVFERTGAILNRLVKIAHESNPPNM